MKRIIVLVLAVVLAVPLVALAPNISSAQTAADKLPDLGMAPLRNLSVENRSNGQHLLRFDAIIVNVGTGPFEVLGNRTEASDPTMDTVTQRIFDSEGAYREVPATNTSPDTPGYGTSAQMVFGGDGHNHWHVKNLEDYELDRLDNGAKVGTGAKSGFCFYDNSAYRLTLDDAPQNPVYTGCGDNDDLTVKTGLSIGWGDLYSANLPDQYIDITGLSSGQYRLWARADPSDWFTESSNSNNYTWTDIQLTKNKKGKYSVTVKAQGPSA